MTATTLLDTPRTADIDALPALYDGLIKLARAGLGISGFGVNVMDLPPGYATQAHDESATGQEEVYVALRGSGAVVVDGEALALAPGKLVAVPPPVARTLTAGPGGCRVLIIGGTPGAPYAAPEWTGGDEAS